jgi:hypothetical protein
VSFEALSSFGVLVLYEIQLLERSNTAVALHRA